MYIGATRLRADARLTRDGVDSDVRLRYASMDLSNPFYNSCMREMPAEVFFSRYQPKCIRVFVGEWGSSCVYVCVYVCVCVCVCVCVVFVCVCVCVFVIPFFRKDVLMHALLFSHVEGKIKK